jgi:hypothetical protein
LNKYIPIFLGLDTSNRTKYYEFRTSLHHPVACVTDVATNTVYTTLFIYPLFIYLFRFSRTIFRHYTYDFTKITIPTRDPLFFGSNYNQNNLRLNIVYSRKLIRSPKQRIRCKYSNFLKIVCIVPEDGLIEPKHVSIKRASSNKGYVKSIALTVFVVTLMSYECKVCPVFILLEPKYPICKMESRK